MCLQGFRDCHVPAATRVPGGYHVIITTHQTNRRYLLPTHAAVTTSHYTLAHMPYEESRTKPLSPTRSRRAWSWNDINLVLDIALLVVFVALLFAAVVVRFVFPPGPAAGGWRLWGLDYDAWSGIQFGLLAVLTGGVLVHLMFHWSWVCTMLASRISGDRKARVDEGMQTIYGVMLLIGILVAIGVAAGAAYLMIQRP